MSLYHWALSISLSLPKPWEFGAHPVVFLYLGPETVLPVTSILAALLGVVLMFGRLIVATIRKGIRRLTGTQGVPADAPADSNADPTHTKS